MKESALSTQVGGDHYKGMKYQPAEFAHNMHLLFNQGAIVKYVSRNKKSITEDLKKAMHFCDICKELKETSLRIKWNRFFPRPIECEVYNYVKDNNFSYQDLRYSIIRNVCLGLWDKAKADIDLLLQCYQIDFAKSNCIKKN